MTTKRLARDLERELKKEPGNLALRLQLAAAYREAQRSGDALEIYRSVARAYVEQGRLGQAAAVCRSALEVAPEDSELYGMLLHLEPSGGSPSTGATSDLALAGRAARTRVLSTDVSVRELGTMASPNSAGPASGRADTERVATAARTPEPPRRPTQSFDGDTLLPIPLALHETIDRDSVVEVVEPAARLDGARPRDPAVTPPSATSGGRSAATQPPPLGGPIPRPGGRTQPPPPPPARKKSSLTAPRLEPVEERPSNGDFSSEMSTRKLPKLSPDDLAGLERLPPDLAIPDDDEPTRPPGQAGLAAGDLDREPTSVRDIDDAGLAAGDLDREPTSVRDIDDAGREATSDPTRPGDDGWPLSTEEPPAHAVRATREPSVEGLGGRELVGPLGVFSMLPPDAASELRQRAMIRRYAPDEVIIREGDRGDACYVIVRGRVAVHKRAVEGGEMLELAHLSDGALFGEFALLADRRRHATVRAITACEVYEIPRLLLRELAASYPEVGPVLETFYRERLLSNLLFTTPLLSLVPDEQRAPLLTRFHPLHAEVGQAIIRQGERAGGLYVIVLGAVEVVRRVDRRAVVLATLGEGAYFGEMSLMSGEMASASVIAAGPCELVILPPRDFYELTTANPALWSAMSVEAGARRLANAHILAGHTGVV